MANRILVVDSEQAVREIIVSMLTSAGYVCREAGNGVEALALLDSGGQFELVLSSLLMPELDGIGFLERVKDKYPDTPFVIVSAVHDVSVALDAIRNGAYDYLLKPFERNQLLNTVGRALENRRLKVENRNYQKNLESLVEARTSQLQMAKANLEVVKGKPQTAIADPERSYGILEGAKGKLQTAIADPERSYGITVEALGELLGYKDPETLAHTKRVTAYTMAIANRMRIPKQLIEMIGRGAFLHDIGKVAIPDNILNQPGKLTPEQVAVMREHCYLGYKLVLKIPVLREFAEIVYSHHEHFDGSGYPLGLKGEEIPLGARIIAVANALDSITSDLPYRPARSFAAARGEIQNWSGRQFDPEIVQVFLEIPDTVWPDIARDIRSQVEQER